MWNSQHCCRLFETSSIIYHLSIIFHLSFIITYHLSSIIFHLSYIISYLLSIYLCHVNVNQDVGCTACNPFQYRHGTWRSNDNDRLIHWCDVILRLWLWLRSILDLILGQDDRKQCFGWHWLHGVRCNSRCRSFYGNLQDMLCYQRNPSRVARRRRS